jgi:N-acetylneuraminic acid mutarotase
VKTLLALASLTVLGGSLGFIVAGCGSGHAVSLGPPPRQTGSTSGSEVTSTLPASASFEVWFASGERLVAERRAHTATPRVAAAALKALLAGPTRAERASGVATAIPAGTRLLAVSIKGGVAAVNLTSEYQSGGGSLSMQIRLGQVVYTLTQFPTVKTVRFELDGAPVNVFSSEGIVLDHPVGRSDYKDLAPTALPIAGTWRLLHPPPIAPPDLRLSVWTGKEMLVFGRVETRGSHGEILRSRNVAVAYDPAGDSWRRLAPPFAAPGYPGRWSAAWTGQEMLVWGDVDQAFNPATNRWRRLPRSPAGAGGIVVWTGRELIEWGGGCCGDVVSDGAAYNPATNSWRKLARPPVGGQQSPVGAWTGRELIIFPGRNPDGKAVGGAAYNPATNTWRRLASLPMPPNGANAVWDGSEVLVAGGTRAQYALSAVGFAYNPTTNRWRRLSPMESGRAGAAAVWTGRRLLVWGGQTFPGATVTARHGLSYDPIANRWSPLPPAPLPGRVDPTAVWTGRELIVWGGETTACRLNGPCHTRFFADGAAFRPTAP